MRMTALTRDAARSSWRETCLGLLSTHPPGGGREAIAELAGTVGSGASIASGAAYSSAAPTSAFCIPRTRSAGSASIRAEPAPSASAVSSPLSSASAASTSISAVSTASSSAWVAYSTSNPVSTPRTESSAAASASPLLPPPAIAPLPTHDLRSTPLLVPPPPSFAALFVRSSINAATGALRSAALSTGLRSCFTTAPNAMCVSLTCRDDPKDVGDRCGTGTRGGAA